jgi:hypothetical protein
MDYVTILAQAARTTTPEGQAPPPEGIVPVDMIWGYITSLNYVEALTFISFGVICMFYGWRIFKVLVVISFSLLGLLGGITISSKVSGEGSQFLGGVIGLVFMGVLSVPLMRWAVSVLGAIAGGILTSGVWFACGLSDSYMWAGALIGIVAGGMVAFIAMKVAITLFSSLGGAALAATGLLALLYLYPQTTTKIHDVVFMHKWFLPLALAFPTAVGVIVQQRFIKGSKNWDI